MSTKYLSIDQTLKRFYNSILFNIEDIQEDYSSSIRGFIEVASDENPCNCKAANWVHNNNIVILLNKQHLLIQRIISKLETEFNRIKREVMHKEILSEVVKKLQDKLYNTKLCNDPEHSKRISINPIISSNFNCYRRFSSSKKLTSTTKTILNSNNNSFTEKKSLSRNIPRQKTPKMQVTTTIPELKKTSLLTINTESEKYKPKWNFNLNGKSPRSKNIKGSNNTLTSVTLKNKNKQTTPTKNIINSNSSMIKRNKTPKLMNSTFHGEFSQISNSSKTPRNKIITPKLKNISSKNLIFAKHNNKSAKLSPSPNRITPKLASSLYTHNKGKESISSLNINNSPIRPKIKSTSKAAISHINHISFQYKADEMINIQQKEKELKADEEFIMKNTDIDLTLSPKNSCKKMNILEFTLRKEDDEKASSNVYVKTKGLKAPSTLGKNNQHSWNNKDSKSNEKNQDLKYFERDLNNSQSKLEEGSFEERRKNSIKNPSFYIKYYEEKLKQIRNNEI